MSDSDESFDILRDIRPYNFETLTKKVTGSINCEELAAASADVAPEQPPVPSTPDPGPQQELDWCVFCFNFWKVVVWGRVLTALTRRI